MSAIKNILKITVLLTLPLSLKASDGGLFETMNVLASSTTMSTIAQNLQTPVLLVASGAGATMSVLLSDKAQAISAPNVFKEATGQLTDGASYAIGEKAVQLLSQELPQGNAWARPLVASGFLLGMAGLAFAKTTNYYIPSTEQWNFMMGAALKSATILSEEDVIKSKINQLKEKATRLGTVILTPLGKVQEYIVENDTYKIAAFAAAGLTAATIYSYAGDVASLKDFASSTVDLAIKFQPSGLYELGYRAAGSLYESGKKGLSWINSLLPAPSPEEEYYPG